MDEFQETISFQSTHHIYIANFSDFFKTPKFISMYIILIFKFKLTGHAERVAKTCTREDIKINF